MRAPEGLIQDDLRDPKIWKAVQQNRVTALRKMDHLEILAFDESWLANCVVTFAPGTECRLAIRRVGNFREVGETLFQDSVYTVFWSGGGYAVQRKSDGVTMGNKAYENEALAQVYLRSLYPTAVS